MITKGGQKTTCESFKRMNKWEIRLFIICHIHIYTKEEICENRRKDLETN